MLPFCLHCGSSTTGAIALCERCDLDRQEQLIRNSRTALPSASSPMRLMALAADSTLIGFTSLATFLIAKFGFDTDLVEISSVLVDDLAKSIFNLPGTRIALPEGQVRSLWTAVSTYHHCWSQLLLFGLIGFLYFLSLDLLRVRGTPGKVLTGIRVTDDSGARPNVTQMLLRIVTQGLWILPGIFGLLTPTLLQMVETSWRAEQQLIQLSLLLSFFLLSLQAVMLLFSPRGGLSDRLALCTVIQERAPQWTPLLTILTAGMVGFGWWLRG